jgi:hypothetical protein
MVVRDWEGKQVLLNIEQPHDEDNFTLIRVMFLKGGQKTPSFVAGVKFNRVRWYRRSDEVIETRLKRKLGNSFQHPVPIGKYEGSCMYDADGGFAVFTLQAMTLRKEPEPSKPKTIITPGDAEYGLTLRDAERAVQGTDGVGGGGVDAGGLRDGELPDSLPPRSGGEGVGRSVWTPGDR